MYWTLSGPPAADASHLAKSWSQKSLSSVFFLPRLFTSYLL